MIESKTDFDSKLFQMLQGPSINIEFQLEKLLKKRSTTAETINAFVQHNPEIKFLQSLRFEGKQLPDERHERLLALCPKICSIALFACQLSGENFRPIVELIQKYERIQTLRLPHSSTWPQFTGLTQITELGIGKWRASDSREVYSTLINSMPNLTALDCEPKEDLECLTLINQPDQIKALRLNYAWDNCSRIALNRFSKLESLGLTNCKPEALSDEILQSLELPSLTALDLSSNNQLTTPGIASIKRFKHLRDLSLSSCKNFEDEALRILSQHLQFTHLSLNGCPNITEKGLAHLASQVNLLSLSFGGSGEIHRISFMQSLSELRTLFIEHSQLDETPESLPMLTYLKKLVLLAIWDAPRINDAAVATLSGMTHLMNFQLSGSCITSEGAAIRDRLTVKKITWIG